MSTQVAGRPAVPRGLIIAVLILSFTVIVLGGAVLVVKLRPESVSGSTAQLNLDAWRKAVEEDPASDTARTGLGLALLEYGREGEAQAEFEEAVVLNDQNPIALYQLGLLVSDDDPERAVELLEDSAAASPQSERAAPFVMAGDVYLELDDLPGARRAYTLAIIDYPYLFDAHFGLATALEGLGKSQAALREYREAIRYSPDDPEALAAIERLEDDR